jgi:Co/Zn/Cd efflux system component
MAGCGCGGVEEAAAPERRVLWTLLIINALMFVIEAVAGWLGESTGLMADSLDMLADASVYGVGLYAVGRSLVVKARAASISGVLQLALGVGVLADVGRRFLAGSEPVSTLMIGVGLVALAANTVCLVLISRYRKGGIHMRASWIFSRNDVIANGGVILSGVLVWLTASRLPDLVIGAIIAAVVIKGGRDILREAHAARQRRF